MREIFAIAIGGFLYSAALGGYVVLFSEEIASMGRKFALGNRLRAARKRYRKEGAVTVHLNQLLQTAFNYKVKSSHFIWFSGLLFAGVGAVALKSMPVLTAFAAAFTFAALPYLFLRVRIEIMRKKSSFEGEDFISNFLSAYRMLNHNVFEAMEKTGKEKRKTKNCSELMVKILLEIRNTAGQAEMGRATNKFAYAINTNWSRMFAHNIKVAVTTGANISLALEDILIQLREAKAAAEERKRINAEAARIVKYFIPALYLLSVFMSVRHVGITVDRFIYNQLFTAQGFMLLVTALFLFIMNLALLEFVNHQRFDY
jgi:hypothetical protein